MMSHGKIWWAFTHQVACSFDDVAKWYHWEKQKHYITTSTRPNKHQTWHSGDLGRRPPTHNVIWPWIKWSLDDTWRIRNVMSFLSQDLSSTNLVEWWLKKTHSHLLSHTTHFSCADMSLHDKLKTLYLLFHKTYDHKRWSAPTT